MKRTLALLFLGMFGMMFSACPSGDDSKTDPEPPPSQPVKYPRPEMAMGTAGSLLTELGDTPDPSVIRVKGAYYMVSTTMYFSPGAPIMKSWDLINWQIVNYVYDVLEDNPTLNLEMETADRIGEYGRGQWAATIRYYNKTFFVIFTCNTTNVTYIYRTGDVENGPWQRTVINRRFHDPALFRDDDGRFYVVHGAGTITLTELDDNLTQVKEGGVDQEIIAQPFVGGFTGQEGSHLYKINGKYYLCLSGWASGGKPQLTYRADSITGPWTHGEARVSLRSFLAGKQNGVAQGGLVETTDGDWFGFLFQDRGAVGRTPVLVPMRWSYEGGWPVFGDNTDAGPNGNTAPAAAYKVPETQTLLLDKNPRQNIFVDDDFDGDTLQLAWQWNHNPQNEYWSLNKARPGYLRLTTFRTDNNIHWARNTLTQRAREPACTGTIALETGGMKEGDFAGLAALQDNCGFVGVTVENGQQYIVYYSGKRGTGAVKMRDNPAYTEYMTEKNRAPVPPQSDRVYLRVYFDFSKSSVNADNVYFRYSLDDVAYTELGAITDIAFDMPHFTGYRFGLFNYATKETGGYADFDWYRFEEEP